MKIKIVYFVCCALLLLPCNTFAWKNEFIRALKNGGAYVESDQGQLILDHRSRKTFIPASILKIATAACALDTLGSDYRFPTEFFLTSDQQLVVKGYGDPFLISEELSSIAKALSKKGLKKINGMILDISYFSHDISLDGSSQSLNPYDAVNGALIANFNTINIRKQKGKQPLIASAEPQTPLTPTARAKAENLPFGTQRINMGGTAKESATYFGELLTSFLEQEGVKVNGSFKIGSTPKGSQKFYRHLSSRRLEDVVRDFLRYSTNLAANQIFLVMGAEKYGAPATTEKSQRLLTTYLRETIGWSNFDVVEGSGLSRKNRVTPEQMVELLRHFEPYRNLLPLEKGIAQAKTGTLTGVNSLAGYMPLQNGKWARFALMVNDQVPFDYKFRLARQLREALIKE